MAGLRSVLVRADCIDFLFRDLDNKSRILLNLLVFFPTFIFAAARGDVGTDTSMYHDTFNALESRGGFGLDPLFHFVQMTIKEFGGSSRFSSYSRHFIVGCCSRSGRQESIVHYRC